MKRRKVYWSEPAKNRIKEIYDYYKVRSLKAALRIRKKLLTRPRSLSRMPELGPGEPKLIHKGNYRYLVEMNWKIIYRVTDDKILILDVFDCRQDPEKLEVIE